MGLKRRDFLMILGGSTLSFPLLSCSSKIYQSPVRKNEWLPKVEKWVQSVCQSCPGGCGILVRVVDGKAVKIEGNPAHPVNRGKVCAVGQAGLQLLYNPDRIKGPMRRMGKRLSNKWQSISWEEAFEILVSKLMELRDSGGAHRLALLNGVNEGMLHEIFDRFMSVFGSPNHLSLDANNSLNQAFYLTQGHKGLLAYDLENSDYVLSFGSDFLTSWPSPVQAMRAYASLRQEKAARKAKIIQIEPRFSITASRSDKWIPVKPGTEGLLALGLAYVIIKERLYDANFIDKFTFGFEDWIDADGNTHLGFKSLVLNRYRLDFVSELTGVSADIIVSLAKEFSVNKPAVAILDNSSTNYSNGLFNALAIHSLNALVGSIDAPGGVLIQKRVPLQELSKPSLDELAQKSLFQPRIDSLPKGSFPLASSVPDIVPENIVEGKPYPVDLLFLSNFNPVFSSAQAGKYRNAFEKIPFIVSFSSFMDESTLYADLVLPDKTHLEKWQYVQSSPVSSIPVLGIGKPVVENLFECRATEDIILELAQRMGAAFGSQFPWKKSEDFLLYKIETISQARRGIVFTDNFEETQLRLLEERGWWSPQFASDSQFKEELMKRGGWLDPAYNFGLKSFVFKTPSGRFEFYSQLFKEKIEKIAKEINKEVEAVLKNMEVEARGDEAYMPHYEKPQFKGEAKDYPLYLYIYHPLASSSEGNANLPWLQENLGFHLNLAWDSWAEINPRTALEFEISDNDLIWVESFQGKVRLKARIYPGAMPNTVNIPSGLGHRALGQWARRGINPLELLGENISKLTGAALRFSSRVRIYKA